MEKDFNNNPVNLSSLSEKELNSELYEGYKEIMEGKGKSADKVFSQLNLYTE